MSGVFLFSYLLCQFYIISDIHFYSNLNKKINMKFQTIFIILLSFIVLHADTTETSPKYIKGGVLGGGRSKASIMRVVMQNLSTLRHAYNKRLRTNRNLFGKITIKFAIDEFGEIIYSEVVSSTCRDTVFEKKINSLVSKWKFEKHNAEIKKQMFFLCLWRRKRKTKIFFFFKTTHIKKIV